MSKRLQVVIDDHEFETLRAAASREGVTISTWVRQALRQAGRARSAHDVEPRLAAIRSAMQHSFPTSDIDQVLGEIERGYLEP